MLIGVVDCCFGCLSLSLLIAVICSASLCAVGVLLFAVCCCACCCSVVRAVCRLLLFVVCRVLSCAGGVCCRSVLFVVFC